MGEGAVCGHGDAGVAGASDERFVLLCEDSEVVG